MNVLPPRLKVGPNEARLFQRTIRPYQYLIQLSNDWRAPIFAEPLHTLDHVSLAGAGPRARFSPEELVKPNGLLSLQRVSLTLGPEIAQTSDGVAVDITATIEFSLLENKSWLSRLLRDGSLKNLGATLANRARAAITGVAGGVHYRSAIGSQTMIGSRIEDALKASVAGSPFDADGKLGVQIISSKVTIDRHEDGPAMVEDIVRSGRDFDLPNKALRIARFVKEARLTDAQLGWVADRLDSLVELERARLYSNSKAVVVLSEGGTSPVANTGLGDFLSLVPPKVHPSPKGDEGPAIEEAELVS